MSGAAVPPAETIDPDRLLSTMLDLIRIDSPTGHEEAIGEELKRRLQAVGCTVQRDPIGNLIARYEGQIDETVLLSFHMDTAGSDTGIQPILAGGVVRTDGSTILGADDKSGIACCLELLTLLRANPEWSHPTLEIVMSVGEEQGLQGSRKLDMSRLRASHGYVFDTAGAMGSLTYWTPTSVYLSVTIHGRKAHAGVEPERGVNAIKVASEAVAAMPLGRIDEETVANIGTIEGGEARNIVPDEVRMLGMARSHDQAKLDAQVDAMRSAFEAAAATSGATVEFHAEEIYRSYKIEPDARPYRNAARAIRTMGLEVIPRKSGGGTDANFFNAAGIECVAMPTGMVDEHAASEHIAVEDLVTAARILVTIVTQDPEEGR